MDTMSGKLPSSAVDFGAENKNVNSTLSGFSPEDYQEYMDEMFGTPAPRNQTILDGFFETGANVESRWTDYTLHIFSILAIIALLGNGLFCVVVYRSRKLHNVTNILMTNLAVANFIFIILHSPLFITRYVVRDANWKVGSVLCKVCTCSEHITANASFYLMALVAIDRYMAVFHRHSRFSINRAFWLASFIWVLGILTAIPYWMAFTVVEVKPEFHRWMVDEQDAEPDRTCKLEPGTTQDFQSFLYIWGLATQFGLPLAIILPCYTKLIIFLSRQPDAVGACSRERVEIAQRRKRNTVITLMAIVVSLVFFWAPVYIVFYANTHKWLSENPFQWFVAAHLCPFVSVALTPFLYLTNEAFRYEVGRILYCCIRTQDTHGAENGDVRLKCVSNPAEPLMTNYDMCSQISRPPPTEMSEMLSASSPKHAARRANGRMSYTAIKHEGKLAVPGVDISYVEKEKECSTPMTSREVSVAMSDQQL